MKYIVIFPIFSFLWFGLLSLFLFFLAKSQSVETILLISMTIVSAVRATAYYDENLSKDLAKMIPFTMLGVFVVEPTGFSLAVVWERLVSIPTFVDLIGRYLLFVVLLEFVLRILNGIIAFLFKKNG